MWYSHLNLHLGEFIGKEIEAKILIFRGPVVSAPTEDQVNVSTTSETFYVDLDTGDILAGAQSSQTETISSYRTVGQVPAKVGIGRGG